MAVYGIEWFKAEHGGDPRIQNYPENASETFKKGQTVVLDGTTKKLKAGTTTGPVLGIAMKDATGTTDSAIPVLIIRPWLDLFTASVNNTGATLDTTLTHLGTKCGLLASTQAGATDKLNVNVTDTTNTLVEIVEFDSRDHPDWNNGGFTGVTDGRVVFRFVPASVAAIHS